MHILLHAFVFYMIKNDINTDLSVYIILIKTIYIKRLTEKKKMFLLYEINEHNSIFFRLHSNKNLNLGNQIHHLPPILFIKSCRILIC